MSRLFTFGCSYTSWNWPTWADLLGLDFEEHQNWGHAGLGNRAIAERVSECNIKNKFTSTDKVIVQWSSHLRYDWLNFNHDEPWQTKGSIFSYQNEKVFDKKWIETFYDEKALFLHTLHNIELTKGLLESTGCEFHFTSISDINTLGTDIPHQKGHGENLRNTPQLANAFEEYSLQDYKHILKGDHWLEPLGIHAWNRPDLSWWFEEDNGDKWLELHPSPEQHLSWVHQYNQNLTVEQENLIDTTNNAKTNDYKETIANITKTVNWNREYRGF